MPSAKATPAPKKVALAVAFCDADVLQVHLHGQPDQLFHVLPDQQIPCVGEDLELFCSSSWRGGGGRFSRAFRRPRGRKYVIWFSILGALPFTLALPYVNLFWTGIFCGWWPDSGLGVPAIVVFGRADARKVGMISGLFFGLAFGTRHRRGAARILADHTSISFVYTVLLVPASARC